MKKAKLPDNRIEALKLLGDCGADAFAHPIERDASGVVRFKSDPVMMAVQRQVDLNGLWRSLDLNDRTTRLSLRKYYRNIGYSLCGYLDIFGEQLAEEEAANK